jgi:hypothetical protein
MMLLPTAMTRRVIGGRAVVGWRLVVEEDGVRGKRWGAAAQSSSKKGSSSPSDLRRGRRVERSARCVVRERSGRG